MKINYHQVFEKHFEKLSLSTQQKVLEAIITFEKDPFDPRLKNHALRGRMNGRRSFSVGGDLRIIFEEYDKYVLVIMFDVGTHNQVYK